MVIGIDGNEANVSQQVGVSVYTKNLLRYFAEKADDTTQFKVFLRTTPNKDMPEETANFRYKVVPGKFAWSQIFLPLHLNLTRNIDVFFSPAHYIPRFCPVPTVVTIHDLAYMYYPNEFLSEDLFKLKNWTKYALDRSRDVIAVSKRTKQDIIKFYDIPESKIKVIYNGFEKPVAHPSDWTKIAKQYSLIKHKYVLYVGTLQPRKNVTTLINAFEKFHKNNPDTKLVLVGKKGWLYEKIFRKAQESSAHDHIIFTGFLPDEDVVTLYKNAYCFAFPSLYEGFGVPILEAMSYDCPVITSFASSLSEIGGDACIYFDPDNAEGIVEDLESLKQTSVRNELIKKGRARIRDFSWTTCARETLEVIKST